jgi:flagellar hook-length control protein FliK
MDLPQVLMAPQRGAASGTATGSNTVLDNATIDNGGAPPDDGSIDFSLTESAAQRFEALLAQAQGAAHSQNSSPAVTSQALTPQALVPSSALSELMVNAAGNGAALPVTSAGGRQSLPPGGQSLPGNSASGNSALRGALFAATSSTAVSHPDPNPLPGTTTEAVLKPSAGNFGLAGVESSGDALAAEVVHDSSVALNSPSNLAALNGLTAGTGASAIAASTALAASAVPSSPSIVTAPSSDATRGARRNDVSPSAQPVAAADAMDTLVQNPPLAPRSATDPLSAPALAPTMAGLTPSTTDDPPPPPVIGTQVNSGAAANDSGSTLARVDLTAAMADASVPGRSTVAPVDSGTHLANNMAPLAASAATTAPALRGIEGAQSLSASPSVPGPPNDGLAPGWELNVGRQVAWMARNGVQHAEIAMNPAHLGPLEVRLSIQQGEANLSFFSGQESVRDALETNLPRLREMLADSGLRLGDAAVGERDMARDGTASQQGESSGTGPSGREGAGETAEPVTPIQLSTALIDTYA